jgi:DNA-directed RNA polymerase subunit omega
VRNAEVGLAPDLRAADSLPTGTRIGKGPVTAQLESPSRPTTGGHLINPRIDSLLDHVDSHYAAVIVAAKRARQINNYYHTLGEGVFEEFPPPMVDTPSKNYLTIALEELAQGKINSRYRGA